MITDLVNGAFETFDFFKKHADAAAEYIGSYLNPQAQNGQPSQEQGKASDNVTGTSSAKKSQNAPAQNGVDEDDIDLSELADSISDSDDDSDDEMDVASDAQGTSQAAKANNVESLKPANKTLTERDMLGLLLKICDTEKQAQKTTLEIKKCRDKMASLDALRGKLDLDALVDPQTKGIDLTAKDSDSDDVRTLKQEFNQLCEAAKRIGLDVDVKKTSYSEQELSSLGRKIDALHKILDQDLQMDLKKAQECVSLFHELYQIFQRNYEKFKKMLDAMIEAIRNSAR